MTMKNLRYCIAGLLSAAVVSAADLATYSFTGSLYTPVEADNLSGSAVTFGSGLGSQGISGVNGIPAPSLYVFCNVIDEAVSATSNDYVTFTIAADEGYRLNLSALSFSYTVNTSTETPAGEMGTFAVRSDVDAYAANIASFDKAAVAGQNNGWVSTGSISLSSGVYQGKEAITFRIFLNDNIATNKYSMRIDNILLTGDVVEATVIPEPSLAAMLAGAGVLLLAGARRRR